MTEKDDTTIKLKNGTNYYGWIKQLFNSLDDKDLLTEKEELSSDPDSTKNTQIKKKTTDYGHKKYPSGSFGRYP